jgi:hypothetical protein
MLYCNKGPTVRDFAATFRISLTNNSYVSIKFKAQGIVSIPREKSTVFGPKYVFSKVQKGEGFFFVKV